MLSFLVYLFIGAAVLPYGDKNLFDELMRKLREKLVDYNGNIGRYKYFVFGPHLNWGDSYSTESRDDFEENIYKDFGDVDPFYRLPNICKRYEEQFLNFNAEQWKKIIKCKPQFFNLT